MTSALQTPPPAPSAPRDAVAVTPRVRSTARRWVFWVVVVVLAVLGAGFAVLATASGIPDSGRYSLESAGPSGSKAVAEVLRQQGVDVVRADTLAEAQAAVAGHDATVLFTDPFGYLDPTGQRELAETGAELVLVDPSSAVLSVLAPGIAPAGVVEDAPTVDAGCTLPAAERAGTITRSGTTFRAVGGSEAVSCFRSFDDAFSLVRVQPAEGGPVTALGAGDVITNDAVTRNGNAALALGLLGAHPTLVWYLPTAADAAGTAPPTLGDLTPGWVTPVVLLALLVVVAAGVWRGRRFGAVVVENLPVTVRASETMEGRARLYARQGAHARALDALRIGAVQRLTQTLALPRHAPVAEVAAAAAAVAGLPVTEVLDTLLGGMPTSERELLTYSDRLLTLEQAVHRATDPRQSP
ncbi:DUF4350 domain-containing protein [Herbiconiux sp. 11R-BC]|uniref:DUF4350 domain-containing protein n=1 Tax=Herbiconiux sp. 11R-BC TaxID=3111637 RepID=UPI003C11821E